MKLLNFFKKKSAIAGNDIKLYKGSLIHGEKETVLKTWNTHVLVKGSFEQHVSFLDRLLELPIMHYGDVSLLLSHCERSHNRCKPMNLREFFCEIHERLTMEERSRMMFHVDVSQLSAEEQVKLSQSAALARGMGCYILYYTNNDDIYDGIQANVGNYIVLEDNGDFNIFSHKGSTIFVTKRDCYF